jgi:hypothetical protein
MCNEGAPPRLMAVQAQQAALSNAVAIHRSMGGG